MAKSAASFSCSAKERNVHGFNNDPHLHFQVTGMFSPLSLLASSMSLG